MTKPITAMAFMALWEERLGAVLALPNPKTDGGVATHATLFRTITRQSRCLLVLLLLQVSYCQATLEHFSIHIYIYTYIQIGSDYGGLPSPGKSGSA